MDENTIQGVCCWQRVKKSKGKEVVGTREGQKGTFTEER